eukprot:14201992-Heterocapsa_arctica.AAC.1
MDKLEEFNFKPLRNKGQKEDIPLQSLDKRKTSQGRNITTEDTACNKSKVTREVFEDSQSVGVLLAS